MPINGARAEEQLDSDLGVGVPVNRQPRDLCLLVAAQPIPVQVGRAAWRCAVDPSAQYWPRVAHLSESGGGHCHGREAHRPVLDYWKVAESLLRVGGEHQPQTLPSKVNVATVHEAAVDHRPEPCANRLQLISTTAR